MEEVFVIQRGPDWICVEKPVGLSVHNDPGRDVIAILSTLPEWKGCEVIQPVHRLDRETSGLLLLALTRESAARLSRVFAEKKTQKHYQALVHGALPEDGSRGLWDTPLSKEAGGRTDPRGKGKKVPALTRYRVAARSPHYTLIDIELLTGRKHQIRRHAKLAGHPVVGDPRYGSPRAIEFLKTRKNFSRMALHAMGLSFQDGPDRVEIKSPGLPRTIQALLDEDIAEET